MSTTAWVILGVIVVFVLWIIMIYNRLVTMRQRVNQSFADVDVQLKQRHDLIPNLVETVKGYAAHERGTLEAVVRRATPPWRRPASSRRSRPRTCSPAPCGSCSRSRKPIRSSRPIENFQQLQTDLSDIENKLAAARRFFNSAVQEYNSGIQQFPAVLFAGIARLPAADILRRGRGAGATRRGAAG